jgi:hypothetical protein
MPRDVNQPPPLNPKNLRAPLMEHFDNTNKDDKGNVVTKATDGAGNTIAGATTASDNTGSDSSKPTVTVSGDLTGSQQVFPGTMLGEALVKVTPDLSKFDFTGFDGKPVDLNKKVEGDTSVTAKAKGETKQQGGQPSQGGQPQNG